MILNYRDSYFLHWLTFDLLFAGAVGLFTTEYTKLLDVSKSNELKQFQILSGFALLIVIITRRFHWFYLTGNLIWQWYDEKAWTFCIVGTMCTVSFSIFNWVLCIEPFYKRFVKFMNISAKYNQLPPTADARTRRASLVSLQEAAANSMVNQEDMNTALADLLRGNDVGDESKSSRRATMPPSMFGSATKGGRRESSSGAMMRSSMGNISLALNQLQMAGDLKDLKDD
jgi:hypothetical protein